MLFALPPEAPVELIIGRMNVDRREFWSLASDAKPRMILSERITPRVVFRDTVTVNHVAHPNDLTRCALSPRGDRLLLIDAQDWQAPRVIVQLSEWSMRGKRLRQWRYEGPGAEPLYAGYFGDRPGLLLFRESSEGGYGLDHVSLARWGEKEDRILSRAELPPFLGLLPKEATGMEPDWPLATDGWMPVGINGYTYTGGDQHGYPIPGKAQLRTLRLLWEGRESRWRAVGNAVVASNSIDLPVKNAFLAQLVQAGSNTLIAVIQTRWDRVNWGQEQPFGHPGEVWNLELRGETPSWRAVIDGEWVAVRRAGDGPILRWPEIYDPEKFPLPKRGGGR